MTQRRGRNEGAIHQRKADGLWEASISLGLGANGKRIRKSVYAKTKRQVQDKLAVLRLGLEAGALEPSKMTTAEFLRQFLGNVRLEVRPSTLTQYTYICEKYLIPGSLGHVPLQKLTALHVQSYLSALEAQGTSPRVRQLNHAVLHRALRTAVSLGQIAKNPVETLKAPKVKRVHRELWTLDQVRHFLDHTKESRFWCVYVIALTLGLREGEILGLQWVDVDFKAKTLHVRRNLSEVRGHFTWQDPKTAAGTRAVTMTRSVIEALVIHRARMAEYKMRAQFRRLWAKSDVQLVFPNKRNKPIGKTVLTREWKKDVESAGLPPIRFHDLRHLSATMAISMGADVVTLQKRLGHSKPSVTLDVYSHAWGNRDGDLANSLEAAIFGVGSVLNKKEGEGT